MFLNNQPDTPEPTSKIKNFGTLIFILTGLALSIFSAKLIIIATNGNPTPYWDQWDGEAAQLFKPAMDGTLKFADFFIAHNEHRIAVTRVVALALLKLTGSWDPLMEMVFNALLHTLVITLFMILIIRALPSYPPGLLCVCIALFFVPPWNFENTLWGFQSQFYLNHLTAILCIWLCLRHPVLSKGWWCGIVAAVIGLFTNAGGPFAPAALMALVSLQSIANRKIPPGRTLIGIAVLAVVMIAGLLLIKHVPKHEILKASGIWEYIYVLGKVGAWPAGLPWLAIIIQMPLLVLTIRLILRRSNTNNINWFVCTLGIWGWVQLAATSYSRGAWRGADVLASRYTDTFALVICLQFCALLILLAELPASRRWRLITFAFTACWFAIGAIGWVNRISQTPREMEVKRFFSQQQEASVKAYLATGDAAHLNKPGNFIPYPTVLELKGWLDDPKMREILPSRIKPPLEASLKPPTQGFVSFGAHPATPPRPYEQTVGSFGSPENITQCFIALTFTGLPQRACYEWNIAGYPNSGAAAVFVTDSKGTNHRLTPVNEPRESWSRVNLWLPAGPFTVTGIDEDTQRWVAFTSPRIIPFFSWVTSWLLEHSLTLFGVGMAILLFFCFWTMITRRQVLAAHEKAP
jgi:hypothetical protein